MAQNTPPGGPKKRKRRKKDRFAIQRGHYHPHEIAVQCT